MALHEVHLVLLALHDLDQPVRQLLLAVRGHPLGAAVVLEHDRAGAVILYSLASAGRCSRSMYSTFTCFETYWYSSSRSRNRGNPSVRSKTRTRTGLVQALQDLLGLIRQRELLGGRQVPPLVVPRRQVVDRHQDREHDRDARHGQAAETRLPPGERSRDLAPLAEDVQKRAGETRQRQAVVPLLPFRPREANRHRGEHQRHAEPSEKSEHSFQHRSIGYPRHRSLSTDLAVRNSPKVMKLR